MKMKAVNDKKHIDCAKASMNSVSTMSMPIGRGSSTRTHSKSHGRDILDFGKAAKERPTLLQPEPS